MKIINFLCVVLILLFMGCGDDDPVDPNIWAENSPYSGAFQTTIENWAILI
jgi:hypothetical protein